MTTTDAVPEPVAGRGGTHGQRQVSGSHLAPLAPNAHLLEPLIERAAIDPDRVVAAVREGAGFRNVTASEFHGRVRAMAKGLIASEVAPGDRVALMSGTRLEWLMVDYAILAVGAATVPIYETSAADQVSWILADSGAVLAVAETSNMAELIDGSVVDPEVACGEVLVIDGAGLDDLAAKGSEVADEELDRRIAALTIDDLATLVYTSGTTGRPKGCMLTHGNLRANVKQNLDAVASMLGPDERSLLFLPLAHTYAKIIALVGSEYGIKGTFSSGIANLPEELALSSPTMVVAVPRVFEKVFSTAQQRAEAGNVGPIFDRATEVAIRYSRQRAEGSVGWLTRAEHALFDRLVYRKVRDGFGGSMRFAFSGGSPLGERLAHFFDGVGVRIFEGYGLTETGPVLAVNRVDAWRPGTVGRPVAGTSLRLAEDGEVEAKGPQVFRGYWNNEEATREVLADDGWFNTGDVGRIEDGFLRIVGRKKELIVTAGGKNVAPEPMEDQLRAHSLISQAMVVGDNRRFIAAVVTIDEEAFDAWWPGDPNHEISVAEAVDHHDLLAEVQHAVDAVNAKVSRAESIRKFAILPKDLTVEDGEITPTLKVRRAIVAQHYEHVIDEMYAT